MAQLRQINNEEILSVRKCQVHRYRCDEIQAGSSLPKIGNKVVSTYTGMTAVPRTGEGLTNDRQDRNDQE